MSEHTSTDSLRNSLVLRDNLVQMAEDYASRSAALEKQAILYPVFRAATRKGSWLRKQLPDAGALGKRLDATTDSLVSGAKRFRDSPGVTQTAKTVKSLPTRDLSEDFRNLVQKAPGLLDRVLRRLSGHQGDKSIWKTPIRTLWNAASLKGMRTAQKVLGGVGAVAAVPTGWEAYQSGKGHYQQYQRFNQLIKDKIDDWGDLNGLHVDEKKEIYANARGNLFGYVKDLVTKDATPYEREGIRNYFAEQAAAKGQTNSPTNRGALDNIQRNLKLVKSAIPSNALIQKGTEKGTEKVKSSFMDYWRPTEEELAGIGPDAMSQTRAEQRLSAAMRGAAKHYHPEVAGPIVKGRLTNKAMDGALSAAQAKQDAVNWLARGAASIYTGE